MKDIFKKITVVFLAAMMAMMGASCKDKNGDSSSTGSEEPPIVEDVETDTDLIKNGATSYSIVVPTQSDKTILTASKELQYFFAEATGITLEIKTDSGIAYDENAHYLSIGKTSIYQGSGITTTYEELGESGLKLNTKGKTIIMSGYTSNGAMYAMYEFLERTFNLEVYAEDEYYIDRNVTNLKLKAFDVTEVPVFQRRSVGLYPYSNNETFRNRMRQDLYNEGWIYWSHSHFKILPKETYFAAHEDWYSPDGTQLCLTNDEMREEFTRVVIELIKKNPDCGYIMLGQEDVQTFCDCSRCNQQTAIYKNSGVMMHFVNKVADDVQAYIDANEPGRIFYLGTFGYHQTQTAPVVYENGEYRPIDDSVKPRDNVMIMVAPIFACNCHDYEEDCNNELDSVLGGWEAVAKGHIFVWMYNKIFHYYFIPFYNIPTIVDNYEILADMGAYFVYHQGNKETPSGGMNELMSYVQAKLMWDNTLNFDKLVTDFSNNYYKEAGVYYKEYYDLIRFSYEKWMADGLHCYNTGTNSEFVFDAKYWTENLLDKMEGLFQQMLASVEKYKETDKELYDTLTLRIKKEQLTVRYLYLSFYFDKLSYAKAKEWVDDFENTCAKTDITVWREMYSSSNTFCLITSLVSDWRVALSQK